VILFILAVFAGVLWQIYLAGHLVYAAIATLAAMLIAGLFLKVRRS
jgi:hypothetical protein